MSFIRDISNYIYQNRFPALARASRIVGRLSKASQQEMQIHRDKAFKRLIKHVYENVRYYRRIMDEKGIHPRMIKGIEDLKHFPILKKDILRNKEEEILAENFPNKKFKMTTGGTTGGAITVTANYDSWALSQAAYFRGLRWMGWRPSYSMMLLSGGSLGEGSASRLRCLLKKWLLGQDYLPAFELNSINIHNYLNRINSIGPCVLMGYASALHQLALLCLEKNSVPENVQLILSTSETMPEDWQSRIRTTFGCPVKCFYGCVEQNSFGFQKEEHGPYYISDEIIVMETDESEPTANDQSFPLIITSLFNYAQPLIRYSMGDYGRIQKETSGECKRNVIINLEGRSEDLIKRRDGSRISGSFVPHLIQVSKLPVDCEKFEFRYELLPRHCFLNEHAQSLSRILKKHIHPDVRLNIRETKEFILPKSRKHRVSVCLI